MKTIHLFVVCLVFLLVACGKDKFQTKPTIRIKNINSEVIDAPNGNLRITLESTDKEGDEGEGVITYIRIRTSVTPIPNPGTYDKVDTVNYPVPSFPKTQTKEIEVNIPYGFLDEHPDKNDTMFFKFTLRDIAGNQSDTISSKTIVAKQE